MAEVTLSKEKLLAYLIIDDIKVEKELLNNAKNDDGDSLNKIAGVYYKRKDYTKAIDWHRLSAAQNHPDSQFRLGYMFDNAEGVSADYKLAMQWYLKARNNGSIAATNNIGLLYEKGKGNGVLHDYKIAMEWYLEAANKGYSCAQHNVGIYYEFGHGITIDKQYALQWYEKSAEQGYKKANRSIERLNKEGFYITSRQKNYIQVEKDRNELKEKIEKLEKEKLISDEEKNDLNMRIKSLEQKIKVLESSQTYKPKRRLIDFSCKFTDGPDTTVQYSESDDTETIKDTSPENDTYYGK